MPIPASGQTIDGVIEGIFSMLGTVFGLTEDSTLGVWSGPINGIQAVACEGQPGSYQPDIIIAVGYDGTSSGITQAITRPTMGTNRSREIAVEIKVTISVFVAGADVAATTARRALNALSEPIAIYFRTAPQETLTVNGVQSCREAYLSNIDGPHLSVATDPTDGAVIGRFADSTLTITAFIRN